MHFFKLLEIVELILKCQLERMILLLGRFGKHSHQFGVPPHSAERIRQLLF